MHSSNAYHFKIYRQMSKIKKLAVPQKIQKIGVYNEVLSACRNVVVVFH